MEISTDQLVFMLRASQSEGVKEGKAEARAKVESETQRICTEVARSALSIMEHAKVEVLQLMGRSKHRQKVGWLLDESFSNLRGLIE